jgi:hypothetical protein
MTRPVLEYHDTAVGRLPRGPASDAALAAAALGRADPEPPAAAAPRRLAPAAVAVAGLAAAIAIVLWRRSSS